MIEIISRLENENLEYYKTIQKLKRLYFDKVKEYEFSEAEFDKFDWNNIL